MAGADIGGDSSVQWRVWGDNVRPGKEVVKNNGAHGREHAHVDETDPGGRFQISIEIPPGGPDAAAFLASFGAACTNAQTAAPGTRLNFDLPIVDDDPDQIQIRWLSRPSPGYHALGAKAATGGGKKKMKMKKSSKKGSKKKPSAKKKR